MNTNGAREGLRMIEWDKVLNGTANKTWEPLKDILFRIQRKYFSVVTRNCKGKKMWLTYKAVKYVKCKHRVFRKCKDKNHPACMRASRNDSTEVKKFCFEKKLAGNIKKDSKSFLPMFVEDPVQRDS